MPSSSSKTIGHFAGEFRFLSNFYPCTIEYEDSLYGSVEHAYQAAKTLYPEERHTILMAPTPGYAKRLGRQVRLRVDWEQVKLDVMLELLRRKFAKEPLKGKLLATGDARLVEGNTWGDRFWGVSYGYGLNHLGNLLMRVRDECR